jgi:hypothetical protein
VQFYSLFCMLHVKRTQSLDMYPIVLVGFKFRGNDASHVKIHVPSIHVKIHVPSIAMEMHSIF